MKYALLFTLLLASFSTWGQSKDAEVAQKLQNPVSDLINVPLQFNFDQGLDKDDDGTRTLLNVQPVIPKNISKDWRLINRAILPFISQTGNPSGTQNGFGDLTYEGFFSPKKSTPLIWGVGPVLRLPTGTQKELSARKWSAGPTVIGLMQKGPWTYGMLTYQIWSVAGESDRSEVNETYFQPFINHTNHKAFTLGVSAEHTHNHTQDEITGYGILSATQVMKIHDQRVSFQLAYKQSYDGPEELKYDWGIRAVMTLVFSE